jgi:NAD-dependent deacetylase
MHGTDRQRIVVLTGAGISADSGLPTFRDLDGLWRTYRWQELASPAGWRQHPQAVLDFYNQRRAAAWAAQPNAGHRAIAALEQVFEVDVITQNVDGLHERAGSTRVLHLHGEIEYARGTSKRRLRTHLREQSIALGQCCADGTQLRPDIVWFGEDVPNIGPAQRLVAQAHKVLVVGTSLTVYPAAGLVDYAPHSAEKVVVALELDEVPGDYRFLRGKAGEMLPGLVAEWLAGVGQ